MARSRLWIPTHFVTPAVFAAVALILAAVPSFFASGCKSEPDPECSTLDAAGNPLPGVMGGSARGRDGNPCAKTKECPKSCICRDLGRCGTAEDGRCVVSDEGDCRRSRICTLKGFCTLSNGACVAGSDEDCAKSDSCRRNRSCKAYGGLCVKEVPP